MVLAFRKDEDELKIIKAKEKIWKNVIVDD